MNSPDSKVTQLTNERRTTDVKSLVAILCQHYHRQRRQDFIASVQILTSLDRSTIAHGIQHSQLLAYAQCFVKSGVIIYVGAVYGLCT